MSALPVLGVPTGTFNVFCQSFVPATPSMAIRSDQLQFGTADLSTWKDLEHNTLGTPPQGLMYSWPSLQGGWFLAATQKKFSRRLHLRVENVEIFDRVLRAFPIDHRSSITRLLDLATGMFPTHPPFTDFGLREPAFAGEERSHSQTELKCGEFEAMCIRGLSSSGKKVQFDLTECAEYLHSVVLLLFTTARCNPGRQNGRRLTWTDFLSSSFSLGNPYLAQRSIVYGVVWIDIGREEIYRACNWAPMSTRVRRVAGVGR
jgi:hypothetical protein